MKQFILLLTLLCSIYIVTTSPFKNGGFVALVSDNGYFLREYDVISGQQIQQIALATGKSSTDYFQMRLDSVDGSLLVVPLKDATKNYAYTFNAGGINVDVTSATHNGKVLETAMVSGQDVWFGGSKFIMYTTRGSTGAPVTANIFQSTVALYPMQLVGTTLYATNSKVFSKMAPIVKSAPGVLSAVPGASADFGFYIKGSSLYTFYNNANSQPTSSKYTIGADGSIQTNVYTSLVGLSGIFLSMTVVEADGVTYVLFNTATPYQVVRYIDDGSALVNETLLVDSEVPLASICETPLGTCIDSILDQDETDVDCGGSSCSACALGKKCLVNTDCASTFCNPSNICATPTCIDNAKNQDETDVDCGGAICTARCADTKSCSLSTDCTSSYCNPNKICSTPSCDDGFKNQDETDVDCGGDTCLTRCANTKNCSLSTDCTSSYCNPINQCSTPTCDDGYKNQDETDVDCGGDTCSANCDTGKVCMANTDCKSNKCVASICEISCEDGILNQDETDVDCGGSTCSNCIDGKICIDDSDCSNGFCNSGICATPTCNDGAINQDETDLDCGGSTCSKCAVGKDCVMDSDCESNNCTTRICTNPPVAPVTPPQTENPPQNVDTPVTVPQAVDVPTSAPKTRNPVSTGTVVEFFAVMMLMTGIVLL